MGSRSGLEKMQTGRCLRLCRWKYGVERGGGEDLTVRDAPSDSLFSSITIHPPSALSHARVHARDKHSKAFCMSFSLLSSTSALPWKRHSFFKNPFSLGLCACQSKKLFGRGGGYGFLFSPSFDHCAAL